MEKHTKGPWRADDNGDGTHCITAGWGCDVADTRSADNEDANARLIAAAPDFLAALEQIRDGAYDNAHDPKAAARIAAAAIAQAKGS